MNHNTKKGRLAIRFTPEDMEIIDRVSAKERMWSSSWIRMIILEKLVEMGERKNSDTYILDRTRDEY